MGVEGRVPTFYLLSPNEVSSTGIWLNLIAFLARGLIWEQTIKAVVQTIGCSPKSNGKVPLIKIKPAWLTEHGKESLCMHRAFTHTC